MGQSLIHRAFPYVLLAAAAACAGLVVAAAWASLPAPKPVLANGHATERVEEFLTGPYAVRMLIVPAVLQLGISHFSVSLTDAETGDPVTGAAVTFAARGPEGVPRLGPVAAAGTQADPLVYGADLDLDRRGIWIVTVDIDGPLGQADLDRTLEVSASRGRTWAWVLFGPVVILLFGAWAWRRSRGSQMRGGGQGGGRGPLA